MNIYSLVIVKCLDMNKLSVVCYINNLCKKWTINCCDASTQFLSAANGSELVFEKVPSEGS